MAPPVCGQRLTGRVAPLLGNCSSARGSAVLFVCGWPAAQAAASLLGPRHLGTQPGCKSERTPCSVADPSLGGVGLGTAASEAPRVLGWAVMEALGINESVVLKSHASACSRPGLTLSQHSAYVISLNLAPTDSTDKEPEAQAGSI